jgi:putative salt-induced outer membrane protein
MRTTHSVLMARVVGLGLALLLVAPQVAAQASLVEDKKATSGATDVAKEGFQKAEAPPAEEAHETSGKVTAGGIFATGNAKSVAATAGASLRLRRAMNQYSAEAAFNYGRAAVAPSDKLETTVENYQGRVRYDRFLSTNWALFGQVSGRRDRFQDLDLRLNFDPGVAYYFIVQEHQHLTLEAGYDLQYDIRRKDAVEAAELAGEPIDATETRHAMRLAAAYDNRLNEHVTFETNLEYLQAFDPTKAYRINWVSFLSATIVNDFAVAVGFTLRYDNFPLPDVHKLDTITTLNLVYTLK